MSAGQDARLSVLDEVLDNAPAVENLAAQLFSVVDTLTGSPSLRRALSDPGTSTESRQALVHGLFDSHVGPSATQIVAEATAQRWGGGRSLADAVERQAVRAELRAAQTRGQLSEVEDELFRFGRVVAGDHALAAAIADRSVPAANRQQLIADLLDGKANESTIALAKRAVLAREHNFTTTIESYVTLTALQQQRVVATVKVARPLTEEQINRLQGSLARQLGHDVVLQVIVDAAVLGGVRIELGDEVIEGTVAGRLEDARRMFG